jgi:uncharacterized protein
MIVISNSSPLIALSCLNRLTILEHLFGMVYIPESVYHKVLTNNTMPVQKRRIEHVLDKIVYVRHPVMVHPFTRNLDDGEIGVLNLAIELHADLVLLDDRKARNEAKDLGLQPSLTSAVLKWAVEQHVLPSYHDAMRQLEQSQIYIPE